MYGISIKIATSEDLKDKQPVHNRYRILCRPQLQANAGVYAICRRLGGDAGQIVHCVIT
jgi:hypothetical protein